MADSADPLSTVLPLVLIEANWQSRPLVQLLQATVPLATAVEFRRFDQRHVLTEFLGSSDPDLARVVVVWQQVTDFWKHELWQRPVGLAPHVPIVRFPLLDGRCFWPLSGTDPRRGSEPPFYHDGRYPFSDRIVAGLVQTDDGDDEALYRRYLDQSIAAFGDLDALLIAEIASTAARDALCDVRVTLPFIQRYRSERLFHTPSAPGGMLYGLLALGLVERLAPLIGADPAGLRLAVERQAAGLRGVGHLQHPVHPEVARRFGLEWAPPGHKARFGKNRWDHRTAILRAVRWLPWTP